MKATTAWKNVKLHTSLCNLDNAILMQKFLLNHNNTITELQLQMDSRLLLWCSMQMYSSVVILTYPLSVCLKAT